MKASHSATIETMSSQVTDAPLALSAEDDQNVKRAPLEEISPPMLAHDPHNAAIVAAQAAVTFEADDGPSKTMDTSQAVYPVVALRPYTRV